MENMENNIDDMIIESEEEDIDMLIRRENNRIDMIIEYEDEKEERDVTVGIEGGVIQKGEKKETLTLSLFMFCNGKSFL